MKTFYFSRSTIMFGVKQLRLWGAIVALGFIFGASGFGQPAQAAVLTWTGGTGTWTTSSANWPAATVATPWDSTNGTGSVADINTVNTITASSVYANGIQFDAAATINSSTITLVSAAGSPFSTPTITLNTNGAIGSTLAGTAGLIIAGTGTLALNTQASYTGGTTVNGGALNLATDGPGGIIKGALTINSGGTVNATTSWSLGYNGSPTSVTSIAINGGVLNFTGAADLGGTCAPTIAMTGGTISGSNFDLYDTHVANTSGTLNTNASSTTAVISSGLRTRLGTGNLICNVPSGTTTSGVDLLVSGSLLDGGASQGGAGLIKNGAGLMELTGGTNALVGGTKISGGTLLVGGGGVLGIGGVGNYAYAISNSAALVMNTTSNQTFSGAISGSGSLTQMGPDTLTVKALSNSGALNVSGGTVSLLTYSGTTGAVTLSNGSITGTTGALYGTSYNVQNGTISAILGDLGGSSLSKTTAGTVVLSNANTYAGATGVNAGALLLNSGSLNAASAVSVSGAATFGGNGSAGTATVAAGGTIQGGYGGTGSLQLGALTFNGTGGVSLGSLTPYASSPAIAVAGGLSTNGAITINLTGSIAGTPTGTYQLIGYNSIGGSGTSAFQLGALPNRGVGMLTFPAGLVDLKLTGTDFLHWTGTASTAWDTTTANWTLNSSGSTTTYIDSPYPDTVVFDDRAGANSVVNVASPVHPQSVSFSNTASSYVLQGASGIAGNTALTINGPGSLTINNSNGYTGGTNFAGGTLKLGNSAALGGGPLTISGGTLDNSSGAAMTVAGNIPQTWNNSFTFLGSNPLNLGSGAVTMSASPTVTVSGSTLTVAGAISGAGALTKNGSGTLALGTANGYGGGTTLSNGVLSFANGALGSGNVVFNGGTLQWAAGNTQDTSSKINLTTSTQSAYLNTNGNTVTFGTSLSGSGGFTKLGAGTLVLNVQNSMTGAVNVNGGTVQTSILNTPNGALGSASLVVVNSGAGITSTTNNTVVGTTPSGTAQLQINAGGIVAQTAGATCHLDAVVLNGGTLAANSANTTYGNWDLDYGVSTPGNGTTSYISGGNASLTQAGGTVFNVGASDTVVVSSVLAHVSGAGDHGLIQSGAGTLVFTAANTYSSGTTINGGTLQIGNGGAAGSLATGGIITTNSTLAVSRSDSVAQSGILSNSAIFGTGGLTQVGPGTLTLDQLNTYSGTTTISGGVLNAFTLADAGNPSSIGQGSAYPGSPADLVIDGGTLQYTGASAASTGRLFTVGRSGNAALDASGQVGGSMTIGAYGGSITFANTAAAATLTLTGSGAGILAAEIDDSNPGVYATSLFKTGTGSWVLSGSNTYTGGTSVDAGALYINGLNGASAIAVKSGAILGGSGTAAGVATVASGGSIQAGYNGTGSLTLGGLSMGAGGTINIPDFTNYTSSPAVVVSGNNGLTLSGGSASVTIALSGMVPTGSGSVELLQYAGAIQAGNSTAFTLNTSGLQNVGSRSTFKLSNPSGFIDLTYSVDYPIWSGAGNGVWDTATQSPKNWVLASNSSPTDFLAGDAVVFDDTAGTNTTVSISGTGNVYPISVTFSNLNQSYLIQGTHSIAGSAALAVNGGGLVAITNTNSYTGGTTLTNNSTLSFANGALGSTGSITFAGNSTLQWNGSNTQDVSGRLAIGNGVTATIDTQANNVTFASGFGGQTGSLVYVGSGTLALTAPETYTGSTTISNGTLQLGDGTTGHDGSLASPVINDNSALVYNIAGSQTYSGAIGGNGTLQKSGSGTLVLSGTNRYYGATTVNGGVLSIASANNLPSTSPLTLSGGGAVTMTAGMTFANNVTIASGQTGTLKVGGPLEADLSGNYSSTAGTLVLDARNASSYYGFTIVSANGPALGSVVQILGTTGTNSVQVGTNNLAYEAFFANSKVTVNATGSGNTYLAFGNGSATNVQFGALDGGNASTLIGFDNETGHTITINGVANGNFAGTIINGFGSAGANNLVMTGTATQILSGAPVGGIPTATSSFSGYVHVNGGTLVAAAEASNGNTVLGADSNSRTITVNAGGTLEFVAPNVLGTGFSSTNVPALDISGGTVTNAEPGAPYPAGHINNALNNVTLTGGVLTATTGNHVNGYAAWNINGTVTSSGNSLISTSDPVYGTVMLSSTANSASTTFDVTNGTLTVSAPLVQDNHDGIVSGLNLTGGGTLVLTATRNTYTGPTTVYGGTLVAGAASSLPTNSAVTADNGGTLDVTAGRQTVNSLTIGALGTLNVNDLYPLSVSGSASFVAGSSIDIFTNGIVTPDLLMTYGSSTGSLSNVYVNGVLNGLPPTDSLSYSGGSLEIISNATSGGTWTQAAGGSWAMGSNWSSNPTPPTSGTAAFPELGATSAINVTLDGPQTAGALVFSATEGYTLAPGMGGTLTLGTSAGGSITVLAGTHTISAPLVVAGSADVAPVAGTHLIVSGNISETNGSQSLTLSDAGTLELSGINTYSGGTNVLAGTLVLDTSTALADGSSLTVGQGASSLFAPAAAGPAGTMYSWSAAASAEVVAVPEPGTLALLAVAALLVAVGPFCRKGLKC
jgi:fibronectin-binding autotransporter adhesin